LTVYRRIETSDRDYAEEKDLRNRILRLPLGRNLSEEDIRGEDRQVHLIAADDQGRLIGCVLLLPAGDGTARIRQMAVDEEHQRRGIGRELMRRMERIAGGMGIRKLTLRARLTAEDFYSKLGYRGVDGTFSEVGIPHRLMEKDLASEADAPGGGPLPEGGGG
jgi:N-acetylglutamate synthase-like GNAT family acetyltransferase